MVRLSVLAYATVAAGLGVTVAGAIAAAGRPLTALALFGAAALAAELLEEPESARIREPLGPGVFRVASGVDLAAVIVLGPVARRARRRHGCAAGPGHARHVATRRLPGVGLSRLRRWPPATPSRSAAATQDT